MTKISSLVICAILAMLLSVGSGKYLKNNDEVDQEQTLVSGSNETSLSTDVNLKFEMDWMATLKAISLALVPIAFPEEAVMAAAIGVMIEVFWPPDDEDVWAKIEDQVQDLVNKALLEKELEDRQGDINAILADMHQYVEALGHEKSYWMNSILAKCIDTNEHIKIHPESHPHTIGITITLAYIHLNMLRERLLYGKFMYNEDNSEFWRQDLEYQVADYQNYLSTAYKEWRDWRNGEIEANSWSTGFIIADCYGETKDKETGENVKYHQSGCSLDSYFEDDVKRTKTYMFNELRGKFMRQLYQASFELIRFIPGMENHLEYALPDDRILEFGPYTPYVLQYLKDHQEHEGRYSYSPHWDESNNNVLTQISVSEGNYIDGLQFTYEDFEGHLMGKLRGSPLEFVFDGKNVTLLNVTMGYGSENGYYQWSDNGLVEMQLWFSDGTTSGPLGNHGGNTNLNKAMAGNISPRFKCTNVGGRGTVGVTVGTMYLRFMHDVADDEMTESLAHQWSLVNSQLLEE